MHKKIYILVLMTICILCVNKVYAYESYKVGDKVTYNGEDYYVIENSGADKNYVTLLKEKPLTAEEVNKYGGDENNELFINKYVDMHKYADMHQSSDKAAVAYYTSKTCGWIKIDENSNAYEQVVSECDASYDLSDVKKVVDNWSSNNFTQDDLIEIDGYQARLLTLDELLENFSYEPTWLNDNDYDFWLMDNYEDRNNSKSLLSKNEVKLGFLYNPLGVIRPVINLAKCAIGDCTNCENGYKYKTEKVKKYNGFKIGDEITYQGEKYYVIKNSASSSKTLTLLKAEPLTYDEIIANMGNLSNDDIGDKNEHGVMPYYTSDTCKNSDNRSGCISAYNKSNIKIVIDNYYSQFMDELVEIDGYKARLLTRDELIGFLGYDSLHVVTADILKPTESVPNWLYNSSYSYWTMSGYGDSNDTVYSIFEHGIVSASVRWGIGYDSKVYNQKSVRPVINLDKCAVDGGCYEEEVEVAVGCKDTSTSNNVVNVPNTLKKVSIIIFIICSILVASGIGIIIFNYIKARKERK